MTEREDLRKDIYRWESVSPSPLDIRLTKGDSLIGRIYAPTDLKPMALVNIEGMAFEIVWTEHSFYRISLVDSGVAVGEARYLPWRRDVFQAKLRGIRAYRWHRTSPATATWQFGGADVMEFRRDEEVVSVSTGIDSGDAPPLLALGILLGSV